MLCSWLLFSVPRGSLRVIRWAGLDFLPFSSTTRSIREAHFQCFPLLGKRLCGSDKEGKEETELACYEVKKYSKKADCRSSVNKRQCQLRAHERARPLPASLGVYLADQFWYPESSVNLLQAIEIPQGQIELVQESSLITWRFCGRMWAQQVIWRVAKWLPVKRQASPWAHGKASWSEDMFFLLKVDGSQPVDFQGLCNKHRISQT